MLILLTEDGSIVVSINPLRAAGEYPLRGVTGAGTGYAFLPCHRAAFVAFLNPNPLYMAPFVPRCDPRRPPVSIPWQHRGTAGKSVISRGDWLRQTRNQYVTNT